MKSRTIRYALDSLTGSPVWIESAAPGLACHCICPACKATMIAVQGNPDNRKSWHFRHYAQQNCGGGQDAAIRKLARQLILDSDRIEIPGYTLAYSEASQDVMLDSIFADAMVTGPSNPVYFQLSIEHPASSETAAAFARRKLKVVEIDLTDLPADLSPEQLKELVLSKADRQWLLPHKGRGQNWILPVAFWSLPFFAIVGLFFGLRSSRKNKRHYA